MSASAASSSTSTIVPAPVAKKIPHKVYFGKLPENCPDVPENLKNQPRCPEGDEAGLIDPPIIHDDPYFWLRDDDRKRPDVLEYLEGCNAHAASVLENTSALKKQIYAEHMSHLKETDDSCPHAYEVDGVEFEYYTKTFRGKSYVTYARRRRVISPTEEEEEENDDEEELLLDVNQVAGGSTQCDVHAFKPEPSEHKVFGYSVDFSGDECYTIRFFARGDDDLNAIVSKKVIENTTGSFCWLPDGSGVIYETRDEAMRSDKVWLYNFQKHQDAVADGEAPSAAALRHEDVLLFHETDPLFEASGTVSRDDTLIGFGAESTTTCELWLIKLTGGGGADAAASGKTMADIVTDAINENKAVCFRPRETDVRYRVESHAALGCFFVLTNADECKTQKVLRVSAASWPTIPDFRDSNNFSNGSVATVVPHNKAQSYENILAVRDALIVEGRADGLTQLWVMKLLLNNDDEKKNNNYNNYKLILIPQPEPIYEVHMIDNHIKDFNAECIRICYSSMTTPQRYIDVPIADPVKSRHIVKKKPIPNFDARKYCCERLWATSPDGVRVPMSVLRLKSLLPAGVSLADYCKQDNGGKTKTFACHMEGYGSYGLSSDGNFDATRLPLVDRGVIFVMAHIRGGTEMGREWFEGPGYGGGARNLTKRNSFDDFIACAEFLINNKITSPSQLGIEGRSAGGLLMGAVCNMRPDLFAVSINEVGYMDVMTGMSDASIPLVSQEWCGAWGCPNLWKYYAYMKSYCVQTNITAGMRYPNVFCSAGLYDPRVAYWEVAKYIAKLRECHVDKEGEEPRELLAMFDMEAGHYSSGDRYAWWETKSEQQAWLLKHIAAAELAAFEQKK